MRNVIAAVAAEAVGAIMVLFYAWTYIEFHYEYRNGRDWVDADRLKTFLRNGVITVIVASAVGAFTAQVLS